LLAAISSAKIRRVLHPEAAQYRAPKRELYHESKNSGFSKSIRVTVPKRKLNQPFANRTRSYQSLKEATQPSRFPRLTSQAFFNKEKKSPAQIRTFSLGSRYRLRN
jgi:hypothetical protein